MSPPIPSAFIWRRVHSLLGFWLVLYLAEHLLVNSQAALWLGDDGHQFVRMVNFIKGLPFLHAVEIIFIGIPLLVHGVWGIQRLFTAKKNALQMPYARNIAFSWQRITSWILLFGILAHVVQMRFLHSPVLIHIDHQERAFIPITNDPALPSLAGRFHTILYSSPDKIPPEAREMHISSHQILASAPDEGTAFLLILRETFKNVWMQIFYTIFVLAATFHACNGLWTFLITWGVILSAPSQKSMVKVNMIGMAVLAFLGLLAIWG